MKDQMRNVMQSQTFGIITGGVFLLWICLIAITAGSAWAVPPLEWSPRAFAPTIPAGQSKTFVVSFASRLDLEQVEIRMVPELASYIQVQPSAIPAVKRGQPVEIRLTVTVPGTTPPGMVDGALQVRAVQLDGNKVKHQQMTPLPLPVTLVVEKPVNSGLSDLTVYTNPGFPLMLGYTLPDGKQVEVFGTRDPADNVLSTDYLSVTLSNGKKTWLFLDERHRVVRAESEDGVIVKLTWVTDTQVVLSVASPDGQAQTNISVDLTSTAVTNPNTGQVDITAIDSSAKAALQSILKGFPARQKGTSQQTSPTAQAPVSLAASVIQGQATVSVSQCGELTDADSVKLLITPNGPNTKTITSSPSRVSLGKYVGTFTNNPAPLISAESACTLTVQGTLDLICKLAGTQPDAQLLLGTACVEAGAAITFLLTPVLGPAAVAVGTDATSICLAAVAGSKYYCPATNGSPSGLCSDIVKALDLASPSGVTMVAQAFKSAPNNGSLFKGISETKKYDGSVNEASLSIPLPNNGTIDSLGIQPEFPAPFQDYTILGKTSCLPVTDAITITISGTDGYTDSQTCPTAAPQCSLVVPGGAAGVTDTITVKAGSLFKYTEVHF